MDKNKIERNLLSDTNRIILSAADMDCSDSNTSITQKIESGVQVLGIMAPVFKKFLDVLGPK
jgi:hypothetical protein